MSQVQTPSPAVQERGTPVVSVRGLGRVFKDFWMRDQARAVDSLDFDIYPGEIFGLLGPNGSGKSTTIKVLLGLLRPSRGRVAVFGKPPTDVAVKARIGYLPEESYLYPFLNARETLDYYAKLFKLDRPTRKRRIDELLEMVGLMHAQYRPVREYSKGMQRRIGLAQALINDPDLLILDEPTTGLDPIGTRQVKDLILSLGARGKTILLSSHLLADVEDCVDRMAILYGGKKREEGTCNELLVSRERTTITAESLDDETIAEIDALIRQRSGGERSILRVDSPRQTLEQKFLDIVERARAERMVTSGATHAGQTAAFLTDGKGEGDQGDALLSRLVDDGSAATYRSDDRFSEQGQDAAAASSSRRDTQTQQDSVIDALLTPAAEQAPAAPTESHAHSKAAQHAGQQPSHGASGGKHDQQVDEDVIGSLLDAGDDDDGNRPGEKGPSA